MSKRETSITSLKDIMNRELFSEELLKSLEAYKVDYTERLKQLHAGGLMVPNRTTLPIEESRKLMEKHGLLGALSGFADNEEDENG